MNLKAEKFKASLAALYDRYIKSHPFISAIFHEQKLTKEIYIAYLRETYFLVTQTPFFLSKAASHTSNPDLQTWFLKFALEERGHNQLCKKDLKLLGVNPDMELSSQPGLGAWTMISQCHYLAEKDPIGLIGFAIATEGLGADLAGEAALKLELRYPFVKNATNFLKVHGHEDQDHLNSVVTMYEKYTKNKQQAVLINSVWVKTIRAYSQLFSDVMSSPDDYTREMNLEYDRILEYSS